MDAMSDAIEGADVMLYGVSLRYKESANVSHTAVCMPCALLHKSVRVLEYRASGRLTD